MDADGAGSGAERRITRGGRRPRGSAIALVVAATSVAAACTGGGSRVAVQAVEARSIGAAVDAPTPPPTSAVADDAAPAPEPDSGSGDAATSTGDDEAPTTTSPGSVPPAPIDPATVQFAESFDENAGLDRFRYGVFHRDVGHQEAGREPQFSGWNNAVHGGGWGGDHDLSCGSPDTQRSLQSEFRQDTNGDNGWAPYVDLNVHELLYTCRDHLMSSMGDIGAYSVIWFAPDQVFETVTAVTFDVNLTDLGNRQWWKVGVVSESLFNSTRATGYHEYPVPGHIVSDVGASDLDDLVAPDRLIASWSGGASAGHPGLLKVGDTKLGGGFDAGSDKKTRHPVSLADNGDGTVTFAVAGVESTTAGAFPECPCRVVFYDHNYTPDKDGTPIGHTWHWDNIVVS